MHDIKYRGYVIRCWPPPIPDRSHDWQWHHEDYDGAPWHHGGPPLDHRAGTSPSLEQAKADIDEQIAEDEVKFDIGDCIPYDVTSFSDERWQFICSGHTDGSVGCGRRFEGERRSPDEPWSHTFPVRERRAGAEDEA